MISIQQTAVFSKWLKGLRDDRARARIAQRIDRVGQGLLGDVKFFGGLGELRIDYGPGYRDYFVRRGDELIILLCGGGKASQQRDINRAMKTKKEIENAG